MAKTVVLYPRKIAASLAIHFNPKNRNQWPPVIVATDRELTEGARQLAKADALIAANARQAAHS